MRDCLKLCLAIMARDAIAQTLDLVSPDLFEAPGSFVEEGQMTVSPGTQLETYAPQAKGGPRT